MRHDPYLGVSLETLGLVGTIVALQKYGAQSFERYTKIMHMRSLGWTVTASHHQQNAAWAYRNARILMGIE